MTYRQLSPFLPFYERGNQGSERLHSCPDSLRGEATLEPGFLMANSLLIVTTPVYMKDYRTYPVGGGKCHKPAFFRPGGNFTCRLSSGKPTPIMQLHSTTGEEGYPCPVLFRPRVGVRVGDNFMCRESPEKPIHNSQLHNLILPHHIRFLHTNHTVQKPQSQLWSNREPGFPVRNSRTLPACRMLALLCRLGAGRNRRAGGKWQHLKLPCIKCKPL